MAARRVHLAPRSPVRDRRRSRARRLRRELLRAGSEVVHVIEPEPENAASCGSASRRTRASRFTSTRSATPTGSSRLHKSVAPDGAPVTFGHTVLERPDTDEIGWRETIPVESPLAGILVDAGEIPSRVGILKVDTEGHDLAVDRRNGRARADVVMVEHWTDLPLRSARARGPGRHALGASPARIRALRVHRASRRVRDPAVGRRRRAAGHMGNLVFVHERALMRSHPPSLSSPLPWQRARSRSARCTRAPPGSGLP